MIGEANLPEPLSHKRLDHIGIAVRDLDEAIPVYRDLLGLTLDTVEDVPSENVRVAKLKTENTNIELLEPLDNGGTIQTFLEKEGEGLHHICLETDDLDETISSLRNSGYEPLYESSNQGAGGARINFLHPDDTHGVLIELQNDTS